MIWQTENRVLGVVGSREYPLMQCVLEFIDRLHTSTTVISGGATGVDTWAVERARERHLQVRVYHAQWQTPNGYNQLAGFQRNAIVVGQIDGLVAFWDGKSRGTADTIRRACGEMMSVVIFGPDGRLMRRRAPGQLKLIG